MMKTKLVRLLLVFIFLFTSLIVPLKFSFASDTKSVLVYESNKEVIESYRSAGFNVIEIYDTFFLAEINRSQEDLLAQKQVRYTEVVGIRDIHFDEFVLTSDGAKNMRYPEEIKSKMGPGPRDQDALYVLQFIGPIKQEWITEFEALGIKFYFPLQYSAFLTKANQPLINEVLQKTFVRTAGFIPNYFKLSKELRDGSFQRSDNFSLVTDASIDVPSFLKSIGYSGIHYNFSTGTSHGYLRLYDFPSSLITRVSEYEKVLRISLIHQIESMNAEAAQVVDIRDASDVTFGGLNEGITGANPPQIVAVGDTGLSTGRISDLHPAFYDGAVCKVVAGFGYNDPNYDGVTNFGDWSDYNNSGNPIGHGTHVSGTILGNNPNAPYPRHRGMASKSKIVIQSLKYPGSSSGLTFPSYLKLFKDAYDNNARIHSNSWAGGMNSYTSDSAEIDDFVWKNKDFNILFAAGNSGFTAPSLFEQGNAKNIITVGATENNNGGRNPAVMAYFSSGGFAGDGRIKPDIVAPGYAVYSSIPQGTHTSPQHGYGYYSGTSMATPVTAGSLAVLREFFCYGAGRLSTYINGTTLNTTVIDQKPSAAFLKAVMINGAFNEKLYTRSGVTLNQVYSPSRITGWGRVDVNNAVQPDPLTRKVKFYDIQDPAYSLNTSESHLYTYKVDSYSSLKITLAYTDYPGSPFGAKALVNDLDLLVVAPDGTFYGNAFDTNSGFSIKNPPLSMVDSKNNVEQIQIANPTKGEYKIYVNGTNVSFGPQPYGLVLSGVLSDPLLPPPPPPSPSITLAVVPSYREVLRGAFTTYTARVRSLGGASGPVTFSLSVMYGGSIINPTDYGLTYSIDPLNPVLSSGGQAESKITFLTTGNTTLGLFNITVSAFVPNVPSSNPVVVQLMVIEKPYFDFKFSPAKVTARQGESVDSVISVIPFFGFNDDVLFTIEDPDGYLPPSITITMTPNPTSIYMQYRCKLTIKTTEATPVGVYTILVHGTSGTLEALRTLELSVEKRVNVYKTDVFIKSVPETIEEEGTIKYRIQVKNIGNESLVNNTLIFTLDPNLEFLFSDPAGNFGDGKLYVGIRDLKPGECYPASDCNGIRFPGFSDVDGDYMIIKARVKPFKTKIASGQVIVSKFTFQSDPAYIETFSVQTSLRGKPSSEYPLYFKVYFNNVEPDGSLPVGKELSVRFRIDGGTGHFMYSWDWSDGEVIRDHEAGTEEVILKHTYNKAGIYRIKIEARDAKGRFKRGEVILKVK